MHFYTVSNEYITYLKTLDRKVPDNYNGERPFIGVIITVNSIEYIAPLSSPKEHLEKIPNWKPSCLKIYSRKGNKEFLGVVNLNYMIPVLASEVTLLDSSSRGEEYKTLLDKQFEFLKLKKEDLHARAKKLHHLVKVLKNEHFVTISCDFELLENNYANFKK